MSLRSPSGEWQGFGVISGPPQFQHAIFAEKVATRVRVTGLCRNAVLSELLVFTRPHEGEVEEDGFEEALFEDE